MAEMWYHFRTPTLLNMKYSEVKKMVLEMVEFTNNFDVENPPADKEPEEYIPRAYYNAIMEKFVSGEWDAGVYRHFNPYFYDHIVTENGKYAYYCRPSAATVFLMGIGC